MAIAYSPTNAINVQKFLRCNIGSSDPGSRRSIEVRTSIAILASPVVDLDYSS